MQTAELLNRQFLNMRAKVLELAADLDRIDRAEGELSDDTRVGQLRSGIEMLLDSDSDKAERVQQIFSRHYDPQWQGQMGLK